MTRNYDTTTKTPYVRVPQIEIRYSPTAETKVTYVELMAIVDANDKVQHLDGVGVQVKMDLDSITEPVQCVDPQTGADIPGMTITKDQLMLGILAFIRADQIRRDAESAGTVAPEQ